MVAPPSQPAKPLHTAQAMVCYNLVTRVGCVYIWKIGMSAVSLDTPEKEREFGGLLTRYTALSIKIYVVDVEVEV